MPPPLLRLENITKSFPGVRALRGVSLAVDAGEVVSVIGENGAGKSTLMRLLAGIHGVDEGQIYLEGQPVRFGSPAESIASGIALIHQELNLADNLSIAQNIYLGREPARWGFTADRRINRDAQKWLDRVGLAMNAATPVSKLSIGQQQMVEIAKALSSKARLIIMDEPTSSLSAKESQCLFEVIRRLRAEGVAILYISHRLAEVEDLSDRVEVLRDGENAGSLARGQFTHDAMVRAMVGRDLSRFFPHTSHPIGKVRLEVLGLAVEGFGGHPIDLCVRSGEIVGIAGLVGAGRTELLECIMGLRPRMAGKVLVDGKSLPPLDVRTAVRAGLGFVPEDRRHQGLMTSMGVDENLTLPSLELRARRGWVAATADRRAAQAQVDRLKIKTPRLNQTAALLSGGNQQKIVFGKWLLRSPKVLLLDEPTRGVDIGAKQEIYRLMESLAADGAAVLFVSSEMEEILGMADRALVMREGRVAGELPREAFSEAAVMTLAFGTSAVEPVCAAM